MSLLLLGTVNLHLAQVFAPDIRSSGELKFNINTNGATNSPNFGGEVEIVDANFAERRSAGWLAAWKRCALAEPKTG